DKCPKLPKVATIEKDIDEGFTEVKKKKGRHTFATTDIEYEWTPPRCASCCILDHVSDKCPKLPKVATIEKDIDEGFTEVKKKKAATVGIPTSIR
nr:hypothetical protein [Tanacetum cinerariifolium]